VIIQYLTKLWRTLGESSEQGRKKSLEEYRRIERIDEVDIFYKLPNHPWKNKKK